MRHMTRVRPLARAAWPARTARAAFAGSVTLALVGVGCGTNAAGIVPTDDASVDGPTTSKTDTGAGTPDSSMSTHPDSGSHVDATSDAPTSKPDAGTDSGKTVVDAGSDARLDANSTCSDNVKDGTETSVDCGGALCDAIGRTCGVGNGCAVNADCTDGICDVTTGLCATNACTDGVKDGNETGVDCGGVMCDSLGDTCPIGGACTVDADCGTGNGCDTTTKVCVANQCSDGMKDGNETGIDCGGATCDALGKTCGPGKGCATNSDCTSPEGCDVTTNQCDPTQCHDGVKDGSETAVDCGGATCDALGATCAVSVACVTNADCASGSCCGSTCSVTTCPVPVTFTAGAVINSIGSSIVGTAGAKTLTLATPTGFMLGQTLLVQQVQGTNAGQWELAIVTALSNGVATLAAPLVNTYSSNAPSAAQAVVVPQYTTVDVPASVTLSAPAWNGTVGGVLAFQATGAVTVEGSISMTGHGFRGYSHALICEFGNACTANPYNGFTGESVAGPSAASIIANELGAANANGGGGGTFGQDCAAGGGGAYDVGATAGTNGDIGECVATPIHGGGVQGSTVGLADLSNSLVFGGAGGEGGPDEDGAYPGPGGNGGGSILILAPVSVTVTGSIVSSGAEGGDGVVNTTACGGVGCGMGGGGGGAGGSIRIVSGAATLGTSLVQAVGNTGGGCTCGTSWPGGVGGNGRIQVTSANTTGTTTPTFHP